MVRILLVFTLALSATACGDCPTAPTAPSRAASASSSERCVRVTVGEVSVCTTVMPYLEIDAFRVHGRTMFDQQAIFQDGLRSLVMTGQGNRLVCVHPDGTLFATTGDACR